MSRTVVGPFNRVEGDLRLALEIADGRIVSAEATATLYRGFEQLLDGRPALDALVIAPRVCGVCSVSQSIAAATALRALAGGEAADNGALATAIAHAAETLASHLSHFYLFFMPDFARAEYAGRPWSEAIAKRFAAVKGEAAREALPTRARLLEIMGVLAGKWPHSLAFQPGGTTRAVGLGERVQMLGIVAEFQAFLERVWFGAPLDRVLSLESLAELEAFAEGPGHAGDFAAFLRLAADLRLDRAGRGPGPLMSFGAYHGPDGPLFAPGLRDGDRVVPVDAAAIGEDVARSWLRDGAADPFESETVPVAAKPGAYSWAKAPRYRGRAVEVGAFARQAVAGHPLILDLMAHDGASTVRGRIVARLVEVGLLTHALGGWLRALRLKDPFCRQLEIPEEGRASGLVEAARGALGHWVVARAGKIARYQIISPTTWNFSPRDGEGAPGPLEGALAGLEVGALGAKAPIVQHVVRSFDPCMVCTAH